MWQKRIHIFLLSIIFTVVGNDAVPLVWRVTNITTKIEEREKSQRERKIMCMCVAQCVFSSALLSWHSTAVSCYNNDFRYQMHRMIFKPVEVDFVIFQWPQRESHHAHTIQPAQPNKAIALCTQSARKSIAENLLSPWRMRRKAKIECQMHFLRSTLRSFVISSKIFFTPWQNVFAATKIRLL